MDIPEANRVYLARDVYYKWKRLVSEAEDSITVYSPFFNRLIISLLGNANIDKADITIVTELRPDYLLENPNQLKTIKKAISEGIKVLTISPLHAKVLLVDDSFVTVGSQNFTSAGRKNRECTVVPDGPLDSKTKFIATLVEWREEAALVEEEFIDSLISRLSPSIRKHKELIKETQTEFDLICEEHEQKKKNDIIKSPNYLADNLTILVEESSFRMENSYVFGTVRPWYDNDGSDTGYYRLMVDTDLTRLYIKNSQGTVRSSLERLSIYPMIMAENLRMGFARVAKTRISFINSYVQWNPKFDVGNLNLSVSIDFPEYNTRDHNIQIKLENSSGGSSEYCKADFLFSGEGSIRVIRKDYPLDSSVDFRLTIEKEFFNSEEKMDSFFRTYFENFMYSSGLDTWEKKVDSYLVFSGYYRISMIEFKRNPLLVIEDWNE